MTRCPMVSPLDYIKAAFAWRGVILTDDEAEDILLHGVREERHIAALPEFIRDEARRWKDTNPAPWGAIYISNAPLTVEDIQRGVALAKEHGYWDKVKDA